MNSVPMSLRDIAATDEPNAQDCTHGDLLSLLIEYYRLSLISKCLMRQLKLSSVHCAIGCEQAISYAERCTR